MSASEQSACAAKPIRVLHIIESTLGGTLRYLENIAAATDGSHLELGLAYGTHRADSRLGPLLEKVETRGWRTYKVDMRREIEPMRDFSAFLALHKIIRDFKPDIVHCHSSKGGALGRTAAALQIKAPVRLYTPNALAAPLGDKYLKIEKFIGRYTDGFIAVSDSERSEIESFGLDKHSFVDVVYPLIDSDFFAPSPRVEARMSIGVENLPLVLGIGRITAQKDPESFVAIIKHLYALRPDIRALWLGSGEGESEFRRQISEAGLVDVIRIVSWQHDVRSYIAAANVLLSTSAFESFGYMVAEALSMAVPAVATDITGTCDIMRGDLRAWLYPARDHERAATMLNKLLTNPAQADEMGRRGRAEIVRRFSVKKMSNALLEAYTQSLHRISA